MATTNAGNSQSREERLRYNGEGKPKYNSDRKLSERKEIKGRSDNKGKSDFKYLSLVEVHTERVDLKEKTVRETEGTTEFHLTKIRMKTISL